MGDIYSFSAIGGISCRPVGPSIAETMYGMARRNAEKKAERIRHMQAFGRYLELSGAQQQDIADAINEGGGDDKGLPVDRRRIWNYANKTPMLDWFRDRLDALYPGWDTYEAPNDGVQNLYYNASIPYGVPRRSMPVISAIDDPSSMQQMRDAQGEAPWKREESAPDYLKRRLPIQPIQSDDYSPAFERGDAVGLLASDEPLLNRMYAVTVTETGLHHYAALSKVDGKSAWVFYDGTARAFGDCTVNAAVVMHVLEFSDVAEEATFSRFGLRVGRQVIWPKNIY